MILLGRIYLLWTILKNIGPEKIFIPISGLLLSMKENVKDIQVREIMSSAPRTGTPDMTVHQAARQMRSERVGSLVVMKDGRPIGILTERDIVNKVVAEDREAAKLTVGSTMSVPLIFVDPDELVSVAARMMSRRKVRRLPVVKDGRLVGMLTENDVLSLSPALIEITREWSKILGRGVAGKDDLRTTGYCDVCNAYSAELKMFEGDVLCPECAPDPDVE
jgi:CBS domain-containing protein